MDRRISALARRYLRVHSRRQSPCSHLTVQGIYAQAQELATFPEIGHRYPGSVRHVRILLYGHYRVAYLIKDDGNIDILGVFHGSLEITRYQL